MRIYSSVSFLFFCSFILASGCSPLAEEGQSCAKAPCAADLVCFEEICIAPTVAAPAIVECETAAECEVDGSIAGRECLDGQCGFLACVVDEQCGERICEDGFCTNAVFCEDNTGCKADERCISGVCRPPCEADGDCGGGFETCQDGECLTQCVIDLLCFGQVCEGGICTDPQCSADDDCEALQACNGGRCEPYTPCVIDEDCFDPNYLCNDVQRCEERPLCNIDADCGLASICRANHCRPVIACTEDSACDSDEECLAGRCVNQPNCRSSSDCAADKVCANSRCIAPELDAASLLMVQTAHGICHADGTGACDLVLFVGETAELRIGAFSEDGMPTRVSILASADENVGAISSVGRPAENTWSIDAVAAGNVFIEFLAGGEGIHQALRLQVLAAPTDALQILVVDQTTGAPLTGAEVMAGADSGVTNTAGVVSFASEPAVVGEASVGVFAAGYIGQWLVDSPLNGVLRFALTPFSELKKGAGYRVNVESTGDELGPVGFGIAVAPLKNPAAATLANVFGGAFETSVDVPILGSLPVPLPAAVSLSTSLPLIGAQVVKDFSFVSTRGGPSLAFILEQREEQQALFNLVLGGQLTDISLNMAGASEGMDADVVFLGRSAAAVFLPDGDETDGVSDVDEDGDLAELVPNYFAVEPVEVRPSVSPSERVGLVVPSLPAGARGSALATLGHDVVGIGFVPHGIGTVNARSDGAAQQVKVTGPKMAWSESTRRIAVHAVFDDAVRASYSQIALNAFGTEMNLPPLLEVPEGTVILEGVPTAGQRLVALPRVVGASAFILTLDDGVEVWDVIVPATDTGGRSLQLPPAIAGSTLLQVHACSFAGSTPRAATLAQFEVGTGPVSEKNIQACSSFIEVQH